MVILYEFLCCIIKQHCGKTHIYRKEYFFFLLKSRGISVFKVNFQKDLCCLRHKSIRNMIVSAQISEFTEKSLKFYFPWDYKAWRSVYFGPPFNAACDLIFFLVLWKQWIEVPTYSPCSAFPFTNGAFYSQRRHYEEWRMWPCVVFLAFTGNFFPIKIAHGYSIKIETKARLSLEVLPPFQPPTGYSKTNKTHHYDTHFL